MPRVVVAAMVAALFATPVMAQEGDYDAAAFERELNEHLKDTGVTVQIGPGGTTDVVGAVETNGSGITTGAGEDTDGTVTASARSVSSDVQHAVDAIETASDYIAARLCASRGRPTKIVLNLTAGFTLVFSAETGSQVEWEMEDVCKRMQD